jgi:hypothetical protein
MSYRVRVAVASVARSARSCPRRPSCYSTDSRRSRPHPPAHSGHWHRHSVKSLAE